MGISSRLIAIATLVVLPACFVTEHSESGPGPYQPPPEDPGPELVEEVGTGQCGAAELSAEAGAAPNGVGMHAIAVAPGGGIAAAGFYKGEGYLGGDALPDASVAVGVLRADQRGEHLWSRGFAANGTGAWASAVAVDATGAVVLVGAFTGTIDFGGGLLDADGICIAWCLPDGFIAKLDADGEHLFSTRFGDHFGTRTINLNNLSTSVQGDGATGVALDGDDNIIVVGMFRGIVDEFGGDDLVGSEDANNVFVVKLDPSGQHIFSRRLGSAGAGTSGVTVDANGNVYVTGSYYKTMSFDEGETLSSGDRNAFVAKLNGSDGTLLWAIDTTVVDGWSSARGIAATDDGVVATLAYDGSVALDGVQHDTEGGVGALVTSITSDGEVRWSESFHTTTRDDLSPRGMAVGPDGDIHVTGYVGGPVDFGGGLFGDSLSRLFTLELDAAGEHVCSRRAHGDEHSYGFGIAASDERIWVAGGYDASVDVGLAELSVSDDEFHFLLAAFTR